MRAMETRRPTVLRIVQFLAETGRLGGVRPSRWRLAWGEAGGGGRLREDLPPGRAWFSNYNSRVRRNVTGRTGNGPFLASRAARNAYP